MHRVLHSSTSQLPNWWFGTCFFSHILGIIIPIDFHMFQRGSYTTNQQLPLLEICSPPRLVASQYLPQRSSAPTARASGLQLDLHDFHELEVSWAKWWDDGALSCWSTQKKTAELMALNMVKHGETWWNYLKCWTKRSRARLDRLKIFVIFGCTGRICKHAQTKASPIELGCERQKCCSGWDCHCEYQVFDTIPIIPFYHCLILVAYRFNPC